MANILIVVFYGGQWTQYNFYENYSVVGVLVDDMMNLGGLVSLILNEIQLDASIDLWVLLDFGHTNIQNVFNLQQDKDVCWFLSLIKESSIRYPLVAHVRVHSLVAQTSIEASSSGIGGSSEANDNLLCLSSSSSSSNDVIRQDYDFHDNLKEKDVFVSKEILSKCFYVSSN